MRAVSERNGVQRTMIKELHVIPDGARVLVELDTDAQYSTEELDEIKTALGNFAPNAHFVLLGNVESVHVAVTE